MFIADLSSTRLAGWNYEVLTENHAVHFCRQNNIRIVMDPEQQFGKLAYYKGYCFILINPTLDAGFRLWVLWHEIGHYILHHPETSQFSSSMKRKNDRDANYVAAVAMMPRPLIEGRTIDCVARRSHYPREIVQIRYDIYENEGI